MKEKKYSRNFNKRKKNIISTTVKTIKIIKLYKGKKTLIKEEAIKTIIFYVIRFIHHIIILNIFKNVDINFFFARNHRYFFYLSLYFYAIILIKYYTHILSFTYYIVSLKWEVIFIFFNCR